MSNSTYQSIDFGALTRAGEGLTQWRALGTGFLTVLLCGLLSCLMQQLIARTGGVLGMLLALMSGVLLFIVWLAGMSAVGVLLMDKARNVPQRGIFEAAMFGLASIPKFLLLGVGVLASVLAFMLVAALIYFICKVPVLGAVLAFVAHPVLVLIAAVFIIACVWVVFPLFAPAVWTGLDFRQALASVLAIARNRLVQVVLMMVVLYIILAVIGMLIALGVLPAASALTALAAGILRGGHAGYGAMDWGAAMGMFSNSALMGAMLGMSVLGLLLFALVSLVAIMGVNVLYLQASSGLQAGRPGGIEEAFGATEETQEEPGSAVSDAPPAPLPVACRACGHRVGADDAFCANCGAWL